MKRGKIEELMDAIGAIDEELIAEAAKVRAGSSAKAGWPGFFCRDTASNNCRCQ